MDSACVNESLSPLEQLQRRLDSIHADMRRQLGETEAPGQEGPWHDKLVPQSVAVRVDGEERNQRPEQSNGFPCEVPSSTHHTKGGVASEPSARRRHRSYKGGPRPAALRAAPHFQRVGLSLESPPGVPTVPAAKERSWPVGSEKIPPRPVVGASIQVEITHRGIKEAAIKQLLGAAGIPANVISGEQRVAMAVQRYLELVRGRGLGVHDIRNSEADSLYKLGQLFQTDGGRVVDGIEIARKVEALLAASTLDELQEALQLAQITLGRILSEQKVRALAEASPRSTAT